MARAEVVATGLEVPEGPVVLADGRIAFVEQARGQVSAFDGREVSTIAAGPGAPNAVTLGADGCLYAAQNGGVVGDWRSDWPHPPAILRIGLDGSIEDVCPRTAASTAALFGSPTSARATDPGTASGRLRRAETDARGRDPFAGRL